MKCSAIIKIPEHREPNPFRNEWIYYAESTGICNGEMIEVGVVVRDVEPDGALELTLRKVMLYQCESCGRCKLV